jgi:hypothetical protein
MRWCLSHQYDKRAVPLADRHYSRSRPGTSHFVAPGRMLILLTKDADALWVSSWPYPEMLRRSWYPTAWMCSLFRNEGSYLSSALIREAVAVTRWHWGDPPPDGMVTIIDQRKVRSANPGYCYKKAGFKHVGYTKKAGLVIVQLLPQDMPEATMPNGAQLTFSWEVESA